MGSSLEDKLKLRIIPEDHAATIIRQASERDALEPGHLFSGEEVIQIGADAALDEVNLRTLVEAYLSSDEHPPGSLKELTYRFTRRYEQFLIEFFEKLPPYYENRATKEISNTGGTVRTAVANVKMSGKAPGVMSIKYSVDTMKRQPSSPPSFTTKKLFVVKVQEASSSRPLTFRERISYAKNILVSGRRPVEFIVPPTTPLHLQIQVEGLEKHGVTTVAELAQAALGRIGQEHFQHIVYAIGTMNDIENSYKRNIKN